jgi:uncharacterized protein (DUF983 family)
VKLDLKAFALARCPRCKRGPVFKSVLGEIHNACPNCGLVYLRESGYFLGAMYVSYALGILTVLPVALVLALVLEWPVWAVLTISLVQTLVSVPLFLVYSRLIWLHLDHAIDPR